MGHHGSLDGPNLRAPHVRIAVQEAGLSEAWGFPWSSDQLLKMAIEIVDLPNLKMVIFHSYVSGISLTNWC